MRTTFTLNKQQYAYHRLVRSLSVAVPRAFRSPIYKGLRADAAGHLHLPRLLPSQTFSRVFTSTRLTMSESDFYKLSAEKPNGTQYDFEQLKGKVILIVNVASKWYVLRAVSPSPRVA